MPQKYKNPSMQKLYDGLLVLAADPSSELYLKDGGQHRGASHRCAFWDGFSGKFDFSGPKRSSQVMPGTLTAACFMAGREWARQTAKSTRAQAASQHGGAGRGQGRKPQDPDGELMRSRAVRMTDAEWADAKTVGMAELRAWVKTRAAQLRAGAFATAA